MQKISNSRAGSAVIKIIRCLRFKPDRSSLELKVLRIDFFTPTQFDDVKLRIYKIKNVQGKINKLDGE